MPPRPPTRTVPTVIVPGWWGSGEGHWQFWLGEQLTQAGREVRWADLGDLENPKLEEWLAGLRSTLAGLPELGYDVVAHSLGSALWLHHVASNIDSPRPDRVALVAPPSPKFMALVPEISGFSAVPLDVDTIRRAADGTVLVAGSEDPYCPEGIAAAYGQPLKLATTVIPDAGHLNIEDGHGPWPAVLDWCGRDNLAFY